MSFPGILFYDSLINKMKLIAREPCLYHLAIESIERFNTEFFFFFIWCRTALSKIIKARGYKKVNIAVLTAIKPLNPFN